MFISACILTFKVVQINISCEQKQINNEQQYIYKLTLT